MKKISAYVICFLAVSFAMFIVVCCAVPSFGEYFLVQYVGPRNSYGDLYQMAEISQFRTPLSAVLSAETSTLNDARIVVYGDSFADSHYESPTLSNELSSALHEPVYHAVGSLPDVIASMEFAASTSPDPKILIIESVERAVVDRALTYGTLFSSTTSIKQSSNINSFFDASKVDYFFKHNIFINPVRVYLKQLNFSLLHRIDPRIGAYSLNPPMLFYYDEVAFANFETIPMTKVSDAIKQLSDTLKEKNITLIYLAIPNKYSVYFDVVAGGSYNGFLFGLMSGLSEREVIAPDLLASFNQQRVANPSEFLYYPNDTHFTPLGKQIVVDNLVQSIKNLSRSPQKNSQAIKH